MQIIEVIPAIRWRNTRTDATASLYGAVPWLSDTERDAWKTETFGFTWRRSDGCVGLGRAPARTQEEAEAIMARVNNLTPERSTL